MAEDIHVFLGRNTKGEVVRINLTKAPHILLAGTTGSGKSCLMHLMLAPLVASMSPKNLELYIGDPKKVEFSEYANLPQVKMVANSVADHELMLKHLCEIMDARYTWMMERKIKDAKNSFLSNIVVLIDEFGDLVIHPVLGKQIKMSLTRIVQLGRAAGITCIIATQNPVGKTVDTTIKANAPTVVCLKVRSSVNSRVVLDREGGENLRGNGHGLLLDPYRQGLVEFQAPLISEETLKHQFYVARERYGKTNENKTKAGGV